VKYTGVILAGGMSRRMGEDKGTLLLGDRTVIEYVIETVSQVVDELLLITNKPENYQRFGIPIFTDILQANGALVGIHAGLIASQTYHSLFVACDMPFVKKQLLEYMTSKLQHEKESELKCAKVSKMPKVVMDTEETPIINNQSSIVNCQSAIRNPQSAIEIVIPKSRYGYEPLCAIYSKRCISEIESMVLNGIMKTSSLFEKFRTCVISEDKISALDSEDSFFNINSKEDYEKALELVEKD